MADPRSLNALDVAERFANGKATKEELEAASAASAAAWDAAWAESAAAWDAAWDAARDAAKDSASAAGQNERTAQEEVFKLMCDGKAPWQTQG